MKHVVTGPVSLYSRGLILGGAVLIAATITMMVTTLWSDPLSPVSEEGIPLPFGAVSQNLAGYVGNTGITKKNIPVRTFTFHNDEVSEVVQGTEAKDFIDFVLTPDSPTITVNAPLTAVLGNKNFFGYVYTLPNGQLENERRTLARTQAVSFRDQFPGIFFASEKARTTGDSIAKFEQDNGVMMMPAAQVKLQKNTRYVLIVNDIDTSFKVRSVVWCGNGTVETSGGEQCDDGNTNSGDSCTNECKIQGSSWHNAAKPEDVTGDGKILEGDANAISAFLNGRTSVPVGTEPAPPFYDVNNDGVITSNDKLRVINWLNSNPWCGNGTTESSNDEECDDGNTVDDDTCSNQCAFPSVPFGN